MKLIREAEERFRVQDYGRAAGIDGVERIELRRFNDDCGSLTELARLDGGRLEGMQEFHIRQVNYTTLVPGAIKAFHVHRRQSDVWYVPPEDRILLVLADVRDGSATRGGRIRTILGDGGASLVRIPPGVAHGCRNVGTQTARIVYFTDLHFSSAPEETDEGRLPWDFLGAEIWDLSRE